jgi:hypothetical protein
LPAPAGLSSPAVFAEIEAVRAEDRCFPHRRARTPDGSRQECLLYEVTIRRTSNIRASPVAQAFLPAPAGLSSPAVFAEINAGLWPMNVDSQTPSGKDARR